MRKFVLRQLFAIRSLMLLVISSFCTKYDELGSTVCFIVINQRIINNNKQTFQNAQLTVSNSVEEMWSAFVDLLSEAVECFVPITFVAHKKHQSVQPFGYEIKESVRKNRLWTRYIETRNPTVLHEYRKMRNKVKKMKFIKFASLNKSQLLDSQKVIQNTFGNISNLNQAGI